MPTSDTVPPRNQPQKQQKMKPTSSPSLLLNRSLDGADFGKESLPCIPYSTIDTIQSNAENIVPSNCDNGHLSFTSPQKIGTSDVVEKSNSIKINDCINSGEECSSQHVKKKLIISDRTSAPTEVSISPRAIKELVAMNNPSPKVSPNGMKRGSSDLADSIDHYGETFYSTYYSSAASSPSTTAVPAQECSQYEAIEEATNIKYEIDVQAETMTAIGQPNFLALAPYAPDREALAHLFQVGGTISSGLIEVGSAVGIVLSEQAERVIEKTSKIIPFYNETEMSSVQAKKNDLLKELSRLCVLLGQAEEREKDYTVRLLQDGYLKETVMKLESNLDSIVIENEMLRGQLKSLATGNAALVSENSNNESEKNSLLLSNTELLEENTSLAVQVARLEERLIAAESHSGVIQQELEREMSRFDREEARWHQEMDRIAQEQHAMRTELEFAISNSVKQLDASEKKRDAAYAEMASMRETFASKSNLAEKEFARLKECMAAQRDSYNQSLEEQAVAHSNTKTRLAVAEEENRRHVSDLALAVTRINILMKENSQMQEKTDLLVKTSHLVSSEQSELLKKGEDLKNSFEAEKKLLVDQIGSTRSRLADIETENDRLYHENNLLREQLGSQKQQLQLAVDSLQERCSMLEIDKDSMQREFVASLALVEVNSDAARESLQATIAELSEKMSTASSEKERFQAEVLELQLLRDVLNAELAASKIEVIGLVVHDGLRNKSQQQQGSASLLEEAAATLESDPSLIVSDDDLERK